MRHALVKRAQSRARRIEPRRVRIRIMRVAASLAALAWTGIASAQTLAALSPPSPQPAVTSAPPAQTLAALPVTGPHLVGTGRAHPTAAWTDFDAHQSHPSGTTRVARRAVVKCAHIVEERIPDRHAFVDGCMSRAAC